MSTPELKKLSGTENPLANIRRVFGRNLRETSPTTVSRARETSADRSAAMAARIGNVDISPLAGIRSGEAVLFPGSEHAIRNVTSSLEAAQETLSMRVIAEKEPSALTHSFMIGTKRAIAIGAMLVGIPSIAYAAGGIPHDATHITGYVCTAATVYGAMSWLLVRRVSDPKSTAGKMFQLGARMLPFAFTGMMLNLAYGANQTGGILVDYVGKMFNYVIYGTGALVLAATYRNVRQALRTKMADPDPNFPGGGWHLFKSRLTTTIDLFACNLRMGTGSNYLTYRTIVPLAGAMGLGIAYCSSVPALGLVGLGAAIGIRLCTDHTKRQRMTRFMTEFIPKGFEFTKKEVSIIGDKIAAKFNIEEQRMKAIKDGITSRIPNDLLITRQSLEYVLDVAIRYLPLWALGIPFADQVYPAFLAADAIHGHAQALWKWTCDLATVYFSYLTIYADVHSIFASINSAIARKSAITHVDRMYISDAERARQQVLCTRLCAFIKDTDKDISEMIDALIMEYPNQEVDLLSEVNPFLDLKAVRMILAGKKVNKDIVKPMIRRIYDRFHERYAALPPQGAPREAIDQAARNFADLLEELGNEYFPHEIGDNTVIKIVRDILAEDSSAHPDVVNMKKGEYEVHPDREFQVKGEEPYMREVENALRVRGLKFLEMAREFRLLADGGIIDRDTLKKAYLEMLNNYSVAFNHMTRKLEALSDRFATKGENQEDFFTHVGDTRYLVWRMITGGRVPRNIPEHIPATMVRVNNPRYNHLEGDNPENKRYIWLTRKSALELLNISQAASQDIKYVNNTPEGFNEAGHKLGKLELWGRTLDEAVGFYSDTEWLSARGLVGWDNQPRPNAQGELIWVHTQENPPEGFDEALTKWGNNQYGDYFETWQKLSGNRWAINEPYGLALAPSEHINISDEKYIDVNSERELSTELSHTAEKDKTIIVPNPRILHEKYPNPGYSANPAINRPMNTVEHWEIFDAIVGMRYTTKGGQKFDIPYDENRQLLFKDEKNEALAKISYGLISFDNGKPVMDIYSRDDTLLGRMQTEWPNHMHDPSEIKTDANGKIRVEIDVFGYGTEDRLGKMSWVAADYGDSYIREDDKKAGKPARLCDRYRFVRLDPDRQAKQAFRPDFILSVEEASGGKKVKLTTMGTSSSAFPMDKKWSGIKAAKDAKVALLDGEGTIFIDRQRGTWSPKNEGTNTEEFSGALVMVRSEDGREFVFPVESRDIPDGVSTPAEAYKVLAVEKNSKGGLVFLRKTGDNEFMEKSGYVYKVAPYMYNNPDPNAHEMDPRANKYQKLYWMLKEKNLTARITEGASDIELLDESGAVVGAIAKTDIFDAEDMPFLNNQRRGMRGLQSVYQKANGDYSGTEEHRPRLMLDKGQMQLVLTTVDRVENKVPTQAEAAIARYIEGQKGSNTFFAIPTSAVKLLGKVLKKEYFRTFGQRSDVLWDVLLKNGYINEKGNVLAKFSGKADEFVLSGDVTAEEKDHLFAMLARAVDEKWTPLSFPKTIQYNKPPKQGKGGLKIDGKYVYSHFAVDPELPPMTTHIKGRKNAAGDWELDAWTMAPVTDENCALHMEEKVIGRLDPDVEKKILDSLPEDGRKKATDLSVVISYPRAPRIVDGEFQSVVHGQNQYGAQFIDEAYLASIMGDFRDRYFYGAISQLWSPMQAAGGRRRTGILQAGNSNIRDENGMNSAKPIENGTQCMIKLRSILELLEAAHGLPEGLLLAAVPEMERAMGIVKVAHKPHFIKLSGHSRELGWLLGVGEDEQTMLVMLLDLGYRLRYFQEVTAFESQPTVGLQINGQEWRRYNTTFTQARDVVMPYELQEMEEWLLGGERDGAWRRAMVHLMYYQWYLLPKAEMARFWSPTIFMASKGAITPYPVDPTFVALYAADFASTLALIMLLRHEIGFNHSQTGKTSGMWVLGKGPAMSQSLVASSITGFTEQVRRGWQYGQFVVTALQKGSGVPKENINMLRMMFLAQAATFAYAMAGTIPGAVDFHTDPTSAGYLLNLVWSGFSTGMVLYAMHQNKQFSTQNPELILKPYMGSYDPRKMLAYDLINRDDIFHTNSDAALALFGGKPGIIDEITSNASLALDNASAGRYMRAIAALRGRDGDLAEIRAYLKEVGPDLTYNNARHELSRRIGINFEGYARQFREAYDAALRGDSAKAGEIWNNIVKYAESDPHPSFDFVILAKEYLDRLGMGPGGMRR